MNRVTTLERSQCYCIRISKISPFLIASDLVCVMGRRWGGEVVVMKCVALFSTTRCDKQSHHNIKIRCKLQLKTS